MSSSKHYFKGFDTLRFVAAFLVVIQHIYITFNTHLETDIFKPIKHIFLRGGLAVEFFFVLSGYLITYLLLIEHHKSQTISIKDFYMRRALRIWPLYYIIVLLGFFIMGVIIPKMGFSDYNPLEDKWAYVLYIIFLPNLANSIYKPGFLYPLWSIGVEEQFYLIWAPIFKFFRKYIFLIFTIIIVVKALIIPYLIASEIIVSEHLIYFVNTQKFHQMAIGAMFSLLFFHKKDELKNWVIFKSTLIQCFLFGLIVIVICINTSRLWFIGVIFGGVLGQVIVAMLFGYLLIILSIFDKTYINMENRITKHLGQISYGIYMYHMFVLYILTFSLLKIKPLIADNVYYFYIAYAAAGMFGTYIISVISFKYFERSFLNLKKHFKG